MVPIHYFLALFAILVSLMGCTQKAPPGSREAATSNNATNLVDPGQTPDSEPAQSISPHTDPVIRPTEEVTVLKVEKDHDDLRILVTGDDAKSLLSLMEVESKTEDDRQSISAIKKGVNMICSESASKKALSKVSHLCTLEFKLADGELKQFMKLEKLKLDPKNAELVLKEKIISPYFELDAVTEDTNSGKYGRLLILGDNARLIFNSMKMDATNLKEIGTAHDRSGKRGKNVVCYQETFSTDQSPSFKCQFFFNYDSGKFDEIQVLN